MFSAVGALILRSAIVFLGAEVLRRLPVFRPSQRHRILLAAFVLLLFWPVLLILAPEIYIVLPAWSTATETVSVQQSILSAGPNDPATSHWNWFLIAWAAGVCLVLAQLSRSYYAINKLGRRAVRVADKDLQDLLSELCSLTGLKRIPHLLLGDPSTVPLTFGTFRATILLPANCSEWNAVRRRAVLLHELAHIHRRDTFVQLFANVIAMLWWFQPLCWICRRSLRDEGEHAADEFVINSGLRASDYAAELLAIAQLPSPDPLRTAALPMARPRGISARIGLILSSRSKRPAFAPMVFALLCLVSLAMTATAVSLSSQSSTQSQGGFYMKKRSVSAVLASVGLAAGLSAATIGGSVYDSGGSAIADAKASLVNPETGARQETTTNGDGRFLFENLPAGQFIIRVEKSGFAPLLREFNVQQDASVQRGLTLQLSAELEQRRAQVASGSASAAKNPANPGQLRIGGEVAQANLIQKIQPVYPPSAKAAHIQGKVTLEVSISKEGVPDDIRVMSAPNEDLAQSALDAVRQWRYSPTLLNGQPINVITEVNVNYTLSQ